MKQTNFDSALYDTIVIGGGSSGLMAAGTAASTKSSVLLIEKNSQLGKKLAITGGGRCNITHDKRNFKELLEHFPQAKKFLYSAFSQYAVTETFEFFENDMNLPLVTQARKRTFPVSEKATQVRDVMVRYCKQNQVQFALSTTVTKLTKTDDGWVVKTNKGNYTCHKLILSTGGYAAPETGSTGDGFGWLSDLGHTVAKPSPSIVPLKTNAKWVHELSGTSWDYLKLRFYADGVQKINKTGKILFTHFGISGPLVLNSSYDVSQLLSWGSVECSLDLFPDTPYEILNKRINNLLQNNVKKDFGNTLNEIFPKAITETLCKLSQIPSDLKSGEVSKEQRKSLVTLIKDMRFPITGTMGLDRAVIADGGVELSEIDFKTMQSRIHENLYIIGDLLNINRPSGGFSLQMCWTTGYVAGKNSCTKKDK